MSGKNKIAALVGMCGAGKSEAAEKFIAHGYYYIRLGQITIDEIEKRGLEVNEENEKTIREEFRKQHGMAAFGILNIPKIEQALQNSNVIVDGLYSWSEYKIFKKNYGDRLMVIAIYSSAKTRYARLSSRAEKHKNDPSIKYRSISPEKAKSRDHAEIENVEKGGPIAMADYTVINESTLENFYQEVEKLLSINHENQNLS